MQDYTNTDQQIHWLSQIIAKVTRAYVPEKENDSHTNLAYDPIEAKLCGRWVESPEGQILLTLNLRNLHFEWKNKSMQVLERVSVYKKNIHQLEHDIAEYPLSIGMDTKELFKPLHFEIPNYRIDSLMVQDVSPEGINSWSSLRDVANKACLQVLGFLQAEAELRIWPHHFDTGIYVQVSPSLGIGFGLAMKDSMVGEPYFYTAGYAPDKEISFNNLSSLEHGKWINKHWKGAVLPISELNGLSTEDTTRSVNDFIENTIIWYLQQNAQIN